MYKEYGHLPPCVVIRPESYALRVASDDIVRFKNLLRLCELGPKTWANQQAGAGDSLDDVQEEQGRGNPEEREDVYDQEQQPRRFLGVSYAWMARARDAWLYDFDWRAREERINAFPHFRLSVADARCGLVDLHLVALFSRRPDAVPVLLMHGWPGSFLEFLPVLARLAAKYTPQTLPYHVVVPSLPGFALSACDPMVELAYDDAARILNRLMTSLGFTRYVAHGGDVGGILAPQMAAQFDECVAAHVTFIVRGPPANMSPHDFDGYEQRTLSQIRHFVENGTAYASVQGTRPSTMGFVMSSSPIALLAWLGEKFLEWSDEPPPLDDILESVALYWFTSAFAQSIWPYCTSKNSNDNRGSVPECNKPLGYSCFPNSTLPTPLSWLRDIKNLVWISEHERGGHFPAMEQPDELLADIEDFVAKFTTKRWVDRSSPHTRSPATDSSSS